MTIIRERTAKITSGLATLIVIRLEDAQDQVLMIACHVHSTVLEICMVNVYEIHIGVVKIVICTLAHVTQDEMDVTDPVLMIESNA